VRPRRPTATTTFGSGRREAHDASAFYERFAVPHISADSHVEASTAVDVIHCGDARAMQAVPSDSVALVVTSPPYFAGKQYEEDLGADGVPATYLEYLQLLRDVFAECRRVLEPGGRIAVNVANLGRRPYRSLSGDVTAILQDLGLLLRGEVVWWKGRAAGGSCAWGTFQRPANPVLRDVTERIVIASKGRFDRALTPVTRLQQGLPSTATITRDEFLEATTDLWELAPESATRVGHPAPFPVELPTRLIELYTYAGDVVLDPFMGSGSAAVAALRTGRRYIGFDTDPGYVDAARLRLAEEAERLPGPDPSADRPAASMPAAPTEDASGGRSASVPASPSEDAIEEHTGIDQPEADLARAVREGRSAKDVARLLLAASGFSDIRPEVKPRGLGMAISFLATDRAGAEWAFDLSGGFTTGANGLRRSDVLWKALGKAAVLHEATGVRLVLLTTQAPGDGTPGHRALAAMRGPGRPVLDVVELLDPEGTARLRRYAEGVPPS
jgi:site-specific DNA-methyltransferase (adenine-specific)